MSVGMQFKIKYANSDWAGVWDVKSVESRVVTAHPQVVITRSDPPTTRILLLDGQVDVSSRRKLVVEDMIVSGAHHFAQSVHDPHRHRGRREERAAKSLAAHKPVAVLSKPRIMPNAVDGHVDKHVDGQEFGVWRPGYDFDLEHERPYDDDVHQFDLHECFIDQMWAAQCDLCEGNIGCQHCCGDVELDTCGTCDCGSYDCNGQADCKYCPKFGPNSGDEFAASTQDYESFFLSEADTQALHIAQDNFQHAKLQNPNYQRWMGSVTNSLCGICSQPVGIESYPSKCKHLFHQHCLSQTLASPLQCGFCKQPVNVSMLHPSHLSVDANPQQALREAIRACAAKHDRKPAT
eukprot:COSAG01_NODE_1035_length_11997_cov_95.509665_8_plen_349_part_00